MIDYEKSYKAVKEVACKINNQLADFVSEMFKNRYISIEEYSRLFKTIHKNTTDIFFNLLLED